MNIYSLKLKSIYYYLKFYIYDNYINDYIEIKLSYHDYNSINDKIKDKIMNSRIEFIKRKFKDVEIIPILAGL